MTMSRSARSTGRLTTCAPSFASDSVLAGVRLYTVTSTPRRSSRVTSAAPIRPVPIQPKRWLFGEGVVIDALSVPPACANVCLPYQPLFSLSNLYSRINAAGASSTSAPTTVDPRTTSSGWKTTWRAGR